MRKPDVDFGALEQLLARVLGPRSGFTYRRTPTGTSTQVYRVDRDTETFYVRIAEDADTSFAPEAALHVALRDAGVRVPAVVHYEPFDDGLARSVLVTTAVPGGPMDATTPAKAVATIGRTAGRDLARIHSVPVHGFGWISRDHGEPGWPLRAEHPTYAGYIDPPAVAAPLVAIGFSTDQARQAEQLLEEAVAAGPGDGTGSVAHGDFDTSHIFQSAGRYSGLIDFGEIRGTDYTFDFATLHLNAESVASGVRRHVQQGYSEISPLPDDHERRLYLACVLSASHRLCVWFDRDGHRAADGWFFRWMRDRLAELLTSGQVPMRH